MGNANRTGPPTHADLKLLPSWAQVAFAARCARRVQPAFQWHRPDAPQEPVRATDMALALAADSPERGSMTVVHGASARAASDPSGENATNTSAKPAVVEQPGDPAA